MSGFEDCVEELIAKGSHVDAAGSHGVPLNIAAQKQRLRIAVLLVKAKAQQQPALGFAEEHGHNIARSLLCARVIAGDATDLKALQPFADENPDTGLQIEATDGVEGDCEQRDIGRDINDDRQERARIEQQYIEILDAQRLDFDETVARLMSNEVKLREEQRLAMQAQINLMHKQKKGKRTSPGWPFTARNRQ
jgi:hypothetical protein